MLHREQSQKQQQLQQQQQQRMQLHARERNRVRQEVAGEAEEEEEEQFGAEGNAIWSPNWTPSGRVVFNVNGKWLWPDVTFCHIYLVNSYDKEFSF